MNLGIDQPGSRGALGPSGFKSEFMFYPSCSPEGAPTNVVYSLVTYDRLAHIPIVWLLNTGQYFLNNVVTIGLICMISSCINLVE